MISNITNRFFDFLRAYPGAEAIDQLITSDLSAKRLKVADFFFEDRTIICEIKTLKTETTPKLEAFLATNGVNHSALPHGQYTLRSLLPEGAAGDALFTKLVDLVLTPLTDGFDDADKQIRDTKTLFNLPSADGLLVILNQDVTLATPTLIRERLARRVRKNMPTGEPYHQHIAHVLHICERYVLAAMPDTQMNLSLTNPRIGHHHDVATFVDRLGEVWAAHCGHEYLRSSDEVNGFPASQIVLRIGR